MGMDVIGRNPKNKDGEYFRNNVWWWRRLWDFTCDVAGLDNDLRQAGHCNDGAGLDESGALAAAKALRKAIADGRADEYEKKLEAAVTNAPGEDCPVCKGSGTLLVDGQPQSCSGCNRTGKTKPSWTNYEFTRENVEEFVHFLEACGGFKIC
jgi:hypothetical protein